MLIERCPIYDDKLSIKFLDLGEMPLVNNLCNTREESLTCEKFPLALQFFPKSSLVSLTDVVDESKLFESYLYYSGVNKPYLLHCSKMYDDLLDITSFEKGDLVVDIGGNDGSLLNEFQKKNNTLHLVNVDCSESFVDCNKEKGIGYVQAYFNESVKLDKKAKCIVSTNVFQHTRHIRSFVKGVVNNLADDGIWCLEFPYFMNTLINDNYDQIYHEHIYYYCLQSIKNLLEQEGLYLYHVSFHDIHTGTLRVISSKKKVEVNYHISQFLFSERKITNNHCVDWGGKIQEKIKHSRHFILDLIEKGNKLACFGAAAKGVVFLNSCGLDDSIIPFVIDDTLAKQGKYIPGTGIQVVSRDILKDQKVDCLIILAHNFSQYIMNSFNGDFKGDYLMMFPIIKRQQLCVTK